MRSMSTRSSIRRDSCSIWRSITLWLHATSGSCGPLRAEDRDRVADRRERIAQLVRERGEELVLALVLGLQRFLGELAVVDVGADRHPAVVRSGV